jgi:hypothetical protein
MAKNQGIVRLRGSIDGVTYTEGMYGRLSKSRTSLNKAKMDANTKYDRLRDYQRELAGYSKFGALLRMNVAVEAQQVKPYKWIQRLNVLLNQVKELDKVNRLGYRTVSEGLTTVAGKAWFMNFDFYGKSSVEAVVNATVAVDSATGEMELAGIVPRVAFMHPERATHVGLRGIVIGLDGETMQRSVVKSPETVLELDDAVTTVTLVPAGFPVVTTNVFYVLQVLFYQDINGFMELVGTDKAALTILKVE